MCSHVDQSVDPRKIEWAASRGARLRIGPRWRPRPQRRSNPGLRQTRPPRRTQTRGVNDMGHPQIRCRKKCRRPPDLYRCPPPLLNQTPQPPPRSHGWQIRTPCSASCRVHQCSSKLMPGERVWLFGASNSTSIGATGRVRCKESESTIHGCTAHTQGLATPRPRRMSCVACEAGE